MAKKKKKAPSCPVSAAASRGSLRAPSAKICADHQYCSDHPCSEWIAKDKAKAAASDPAAAAVAAAPKPGLLVVRAAKKKPEAPPQAPRAEEEEEESASSTTSRRSRRKKDASSASVSEINSILASSNLGEILALTKHAKAVDSSLFNVALAAEKDDDAAAAFEKARSALRKVADAEAVANVIAWQLV